MSDDKSWAILRQVVIATTDHDGDLDAVRADATLPVSKDAYLEFIAPIDDKAAVLKWLTKIGGRGGYVLSVQHPDPAAVRSRAQALGVRIPIDVEAFGHPVLQLHPQDVGLLLEIDGIADPQAWFWDDINPGPEADASISDIVGVEVPVADPQATANLWRELLDLAPSAKSDEVQLGGPWVRFVSGGPSADWTIVLRRADSPAGAAVTAPSLPGISFELV
jgi:hypothetical protein